MNQITVNFIECEPAPANGYNILWRVAGSSDAYTDAGNFTSSPAVFTDNLNPEGTDYEGIIRSDCNESGDSGGTNFGNPVAWTTITESGTTNFFENAAFNWSIDSVSGSGVPSLPPTGVNGSQHGHHTGVNGVMIVTISGSLVFASKIVVFVNGILVSCRQITVGGTYFMDPISSVEGDDIIISINSGTC
jgi:hypothetical protein